MVLKSNLGVRQLKAPEVQTNEDERNRFYGLFLMQSSGTLNS